MDTDTRPTPEPDLAWDRAGRGHRPGDVAEPPRALARLAGAVVSCCVVVVVATALPGSVHAQAPPGEPGAPDRSDALDQRIEVDQPVATGPAVLDDGHVDLGPRFVEGEWTLMVHDDSVIPSVWRSLDDAVIQVADAALQVVPDDPSYDFLGVEPGTEVHVVPQVQRPGVVWVGWNTQDPEVMARIDRGATLTLLGVQGPGDLTMYLQAGNLTEPDVLWHTPVEERQPVWVEVNTHTHANWVFTEAGVYLVQVEVAADLVDGTAVSDVATLRFAVGGAATVDDARAAAFTTPIAPPAGARAGAPGDGGEAAGADGGDGGEEGSAPVVAALVAVGALALVAAAGLVVARGSRAKRRAEVQRAADPGDGGRRP